MTSNLKPDEVKIIFQILRKHLPEAEYFIFGSRIKKTAEKYSDLDLAVKAHSPIPLNILSSLEESFSESSIPFKIDLVDFHRISPEFQKHIQENSKLFPPNENKH